MSVLFKDMLTFSVALILRERSRCGFKRDAKTFSRRKCKKRIDNEMLAQNGKRYLDFIAEYNRIKINAVLRFVYVFGITIAGIIVKGNENDLFGNDKK